MSDSAEGTCLLCKQDARLERVWRNDTPANLYSCDRCGKFVATKQVELMLREGEEDHFLSGLAREMYERDEVLELNANNIEACRKSCPLSVEEKAKRFLRTIAAKSKHPGQSINVNRYNDYPFAFARNEDELWFILGHLADSGWIQHEATTESSSC